MAVILLPGPFPPRPVICRNASPAPPGPPVSTTWGGIGGTCPKPSPPANQLSIPSWNVSIWPTTTAPAVAGIPRHISALAASNARKRLIGCPPELRQCAVADTSALLYRSRTLFYVAPDVAPRREIGRFGREAVRRLETPFLGAHFGIVSDGRL